MDPSEISTPGAGPEHRPVETPPPPTGQPRGPSPLSLTLALAIAAGLAAWICGELTLDHFKPSEKVAAEPYAFSALNKETEWVNALNGAVAFGALGGLLGLAMGLAGGWVGGSSQRAIKAGLIGLALGLVAGALPAFGIIPWQYRHRNDDPAGSELLQPVLLHLGLWSALGLTAGLAFALGQGKTRGAGLLEAGLAGFAGALLGAFLFDILGAFLFPLAGTVQPISLTVETRLLARLCVAGCVGLGAARLIRRPVG